MTTMISMLALTCLLLTVAILMLWVTNGELEELETRVSYLEKVIKELYVSRKER